MVAEQLTDAHAHSFVHCMHLAVIQKQMHACICAYGCWRPLTDGNVSQCALNTWQQEPRICSTSWRASVKQAASVGRRGHSHAIISAIEHTASVILCPVRQRNMFLLEAQPVGVAVKYGKSQPKKESIKMVMAGRRGPQISAYNT